MRFCFSRAIFFIFIAALTSPTNELVGFLLRSFFQPIQGFQKVHKCTRQALPRECLGTKVVGFPAHFLNSVMVHPVSYRKFLCSHFIVHFPACAVFVSSRCTFSVSFCSIGHLVSPPCRYTRRSWCHIPYGTTFSRILLSYRYSSYHLFVHSIRRIKHSQK